MSSETLKDKLQPARRVSSNDGINPKPVISASTSNSMRRLRQILLNLLSNAIKFTLEEGVVMASTRLDESGDVGFGRGGPGRAGVGWGGRRMVSGLPAALLAGGGG